MKKRISLFLTVVLLAIGGPVVWGQLQYLNRTPGSADTLPQMTDKLNYDLAYLLSLIGALGTNSGGVTIFTNINVNNATITNLLVVNTLQASNIYTDSLTVTNGLTNLSLTANTVLKADANKRITSIANGTGALTNNNAGLFGWMTFAGLNDLNSASNSILNQFTNTINATSNAILSQAGTEINSYSNNVNTVINSTSNSIIAQMGGVSNVFILNAANTATGTSNTFNGDVFINGNLYINSTNPTTSISNLHVTGWAQIDGPMTNNIITVTNSVTANQTFYYTNQFTMAPDFSKATGRITTNASFTFLAPLNVNMALDQTTVVTVTNSSGTPISATAPENVVVVPGSVMWVTNRTKFTFNQDGVETNVYAVPLR